MLGLMTWVGLGVIVGILAALHLRGRQIGDSVVTIEVGIAGALVGGFIAATFGAGSMATISLLGLFLAAAGAMVSLFGYHRLIQT